MSREPAADPACRILRRAVLAALPPACRDLPVLVACSGGADSLALAAAAAELAAEPAKERGGRIGPVHAAVVDHGLQEGSAEHAAASVTVLRGLGITASAHRVLVSGAGGLEAAARRARYAALLAARPHPDSPVLLGHTLDDQAETVLLGLGRGSGPRSLAGMREWDPPWLRPLLSVRRRDTAAACAARGLPVWQDPHNADPRFTRARLRHEVLPLLEEVLAGGVAGALARTAAQLREDVDALDQQAERLLIQTADGEGLRLTGLDGLLPAVRRRVLRGWLLAAGVGSLTDAQLRAADRLAVPGPDRTGATLPGRLELVRERGRLMIRTARWSDAAPLPREDGHRVRR